MVDDTRSVTLRNLKIRRKPFTELAGIKDLDVIGCVTAEDMETLCTQFPIAMAQLILDMYGQMVSLKINNAQQSSTIKTLSSKK